MTTVGTDRLLTRMSGELDLETGKRTVSGEQESCVAEHWQAHVRVQVEMRRQDRKKRMKAMSRPSARSENEHVVRAEKAGSKKVQVRKRVVEGWIGTCPSRTRRRSPKVRSVCEEVVSRPCVYHRHRASQA